MDEGQIIARALEELKWAKAKVMAVGYPGVAEIEASIDRALALLQTAPDAADPAGQEARDAEAEEAAADEDIVIKNADAPPPKAAEGSPMAILLAKSDVELKAIAREHGVKRRVFEKRADLVRSIIANAGYEKAKEDV